MADIETTLTSIRKDLAALQTEINAAQAKDAQYSGGLIKALIGMRLEILLTSKALLEQRIHALESGAKITVETRGTKPDPDRARQIFAEIQRTRQELDASRRDAERYTGGLVHAIKHSTVATQEQTLAMLAQEFFVTKYGLGTPRAQDQQVSSDESELAQMPATPQMQKERNDPIFEIKGIDTRITESNSSWSKFAWKLTIKNLGQRAISVDATIEFQDRDGFVVDDTREYGLVVRPLAEEVFTGYELIDAAVARNVTRINAKVERRQ